MWREFKVFIPVSRTLVVGIFMVNVRLLHIIMGVFIQVNGRVLIEENMKNYDYIINLWHSL